MCPQLMCFGMLSISYFGMLRHLGLMVWTQKKFRTLDEVGFLSEHSALFLVRICV